MNLPARLVVALLGAALLALLAIAQPLPGAGWHLARDLASGAILAYVAVEMARWAFRRRRDP